MTTCNAEYNESGNHDKHAHHCERKDAHGGCVSFEGHDAHLCACGKLWSDAPPARPESRCTCRHDAYHGPNGNGVYLGHICDSAACTELTRCSHCLNQDAEIQRLTQELAETRKVHLTDMRLLLAEIDALRAERGIAIRKYESAETEALRLSAALELSRLANAECLREIATFRNASPSLCNCSECLDIREEAK